MAHEPMQLLPPGGSEVSRYKVIPEDVTRIRPSPFIDLNATVEDEADGTVPFGPPARP
jgi:hypothetical protein